MTAEADRQRARPEPVNERRLDFYLPQSDMYVELKTWPSPRLLEQLEAHVAKSVLVLVGMNSIKNFGRSWRGLLNDSK